MFDDTEDSTIQAEWCWTCGREAAEAPHKYCTKCMAKQDRASERVSDEEIEAACLRLSKAIVASVRRDLEAA